MKIYILVNSNNVVDGWSGSPFKIENEIEVEIGENHPFLQSYPSDYLYEDGEIVKSEDLILRRAKDLKLEELNLACNKEILGRFKAPVGDTEYYFSCDTEAQSNFKDAKLSFMDGSMDDYLGGAVSWTAYDGGGHVVRLQLDNEKFQSVYMARLQHIQNNISKFRDFLAPIVEGCETVEEVDAIHWHQ